MVRVLNPAGVTSATIEVPIDTSGLVKPEYDRCTDIIYDYQKYRFAGCSIGIKSTGGKAVLSQTGAQVGPNTLPRTNTTSIALTQEHAPRINFLSNRWYPSFALITGNPVGIDSVTGAVKIPFRKYAKVIKYRTPLNIKSGRAKTITTNTEDWPPSTASTPPTPYMNMTIPTMVTRSYGTGLAGNSVVPSRGVICIDSFPSVPFPDNTGNDTGESRCVLEYYFTVFKKYYWELLACDANGAANAKEVDADLSKLSNLMQTL